MNFHLRPNPSTATTRSAEGLPRRAWTVDEIEAMVAAGIINEKERFELIGGEVVPMSPKGAWHENVKRVLNVFWAKALPTDITMLTETTLRINPHEFREPDFVFWPSAVAVRDLKHSDVLLLVEVADSSLDYDLGAKAQYYASLGLRDYWVIDAKRLVTRVHRNPASESYASATDHPAGSLLTPLLVPALAVRLDDLGLKPIAE